MNAEDVIESHPLRLLEEKKTLPRGEVSLLLARSGVGKSAALINFALDEIFQGKNVFHFSAGMPSEKTHQYYQKVFNDYTRHYPTAKVLHWEDIYQHFMVISYLDPGKMVRDLDTEIGTVLTGTEITPSLIVVDGLDHTSETKDQIAEMSKVAKHRQVKILVSLRIHRKENGDEDLEGPYQAAKDHVSHIYWMEPAPDKDRINLEYVTPKGNELLPVYFCPHDFVFRGYQSQ